MRLNCSTSLPFVLHCPLQEHPSLGQLSEKLIDNNINVIFAVQGKQFHWYKVCSHLQPHFKTLGWVEVRAVFRSGDIDPVIVIQCVNLMMSQLR